MTRIVDQPVLVLNRYWQPVAVFSVGVAVTTVIREMGWILDPESYQLLDFETWRALDPPGARQIRTTSGNLAAPDIIVLKEYAEQPRRQVGFSRRNLCRRDDNSCQYCGKRASAEDLTIDHVLPRSRGGPTTWENCVLACRNCNHRKADRTPREARMRLRSRPERPRWRPTYKVARESIRPSWGSFMGKSAFDFDC